MGREEGKMREVILGIVDHTALSREEEEQSEGHENGEEDLQFLGVEAIEDEMEGEGEVITPDRDGEMEMKEREEEDAKAEIAESWEKQGMMGVEKVEAKAKVSEYLPAWWSATSGKKAMATGLRSRTTPLPTVAKRITGNSTAAASSAAATI